MEVKIFFNPPKLMCRIRDITEDGYLPIQKIQVTDVSTLSADWATNSQQD